LLAIYTVTSAILGILVYKIVLESRGSSPRGTATGDEDKDKNAWPSLFSFGVALPFVIYEPIYAIHYFGHKTYWVENGIVDNANY
jgi:hypothetical protein